MNPRRAILCLSALLVTGCPGSIDDPAPFVAARAEADAPARCPDGVSVRALLGRRCATTGCHDAVTRLIDLDLASPGVAERLLGQRAGTCGGRILADPNDPDRSVLLLKVRPAPPCGDRMPLDDAPFSREEIACVRAWIIRGGEEPDAGAPPDAAAGADAGPRDDLSR